MDPMKKSNVSRQKKFMVEVAGFRVSLLFCHLRERERERESLAMEINFWTMLCFISEFRSFHYWDDRAPWRNERLLQIRLNWFFLATS
jgi:hypothetical protein